MATELQTTEPKESHKSSNLDIISRNTIKLESVEVEIIQIESVAGQLSFFKSRPRLLTMLAAMIDSEYYIFFLTFGFWAQTILLPVLELYNAAFVNMIILFLTAGFVFLQMDVRRFKVLLNVNTIFTVFLAILFSYFWLSLSTNNRDGSLGIWISGISNIALTMMITCLELIDVPTLWSVIYFPILATYFFALLRFYVAGTPLGHVNHDAIFENGATKFSTIRFVGYCASVATSFGAYKLSLCLSLRLYGYALYVYGGASGEGFTEKLCKFAYSDWPVDRRFRVADSNAKFMIYYYVINILLFAVAFCLFWLKEYKIIEISRYTFYF
jgi:hypothetical protein